MKFQVWRTGLPRVRDLLLLFVLVLILGAWCVSVASAIGDHVPRPVTLDHGKTKQFRWTASVVRDSGRLGGSRPCVGISTTEAIATNHARAPFESHTHLCSILRPRIPPNTLSVGRGEDGHESTVLVVGAAPGVVEVRLSLDGIGSRSIGLKPLSDEQAKAAGVRRSNYGTLVLKGATCIQQIVAVNMTGNVTYEGPSDSCGR
jgi:hypothetical protein